ncbi:SGNH/GDSL hydrolase family protein [Amycolatopsis sp. cmx-11-12]|uniref:SGNH/GDSL hydrolase family protein n=1 Tax=Amycolatopsis sp. cmx-11-12 TaxID=2785795 RepID=UPI00391714C4
MAERLGRGDGTVEHVTKKRKIMLGLAGLALAASACSTQPAPGPTPAVSTAQAKVLFLGDSIAVGEALPLAAAFKAGGAGFTSIAAEGGGNVVGPFSDENWKKLPEQITSAKPTVVVYQIATYDWGTREEQQTAYEKLLSTTSGAGAKLVFVTMPPLKPDDFYQPHMAELERTPDVARTVAAGSGGKAVVLDAVEVWGSAYQQTKDGKADRSADGIHTCPQGAARFTGWLLTGLTEVLPGFTPPAAETWANTGWSADEHFKGC